LGVGCRVLGVGCRVLGVGCRVLGVGWCGHLEEVDDDSHEEQPYVPTY